jgi:hypothetical protein
MSPIRWKGETTAGSGGKKEKELYRVVGWNRKELGSY